MKRMLSGIQPSNKITLGNYLGAIKQYIKVIKAAGTEDIPEDTIVYHIVELFESALMDRLKGVANG